MARKQIRAAFDPIEDVAPFRSPNARSNPSRRARTELEFDEPTILGALFGQFDSNLVLIENRLGVYISARAIAF
jgi:phosphate starvation-inducible PhoH-like protein